MIPLIERFTPVGEAGVREFERLFGHTLPADYFEFLCQAKGWHPAVGTFINISNMQDLANIEQFYVVTGKWKKTEDDEYIIPDIYDIRKEVYSTSVPDEFLVIAYSGLGIFVMDFRNDYYGRIYFKNTLDQEVNKYPFLDEKFFEERGLNEYDGTSYLPVSENFKEFVEKIDFSEID